MPGRGVDQILPHPGSPVIHEPLVQSALEYVSLAERANGPIPRPVDYAYVWGAAGELLDRRRPTLRIVNLETSITTSDAAAAKPVQYRMHPANLPVLAAAAIDCCVLANNHVLDWGRAGLVETLETLRAAPIAVAGAGEDLEGAQAPAVLELRDGGRVLVYAFGTTDSGIPPAWAAAPAAPGVHLLPDLSAPTVEHIGRLVRAAKRAGDLAVASIHWGTNWGYEIPPTHRRFAHALLDEAGIDLVHGHSSHHPRAVEVYRDRAILYGCGDFLDDYEGIPGHHAFRPDLVLMYLVTLDGATGRLARLELIPLQQCRFRLQHPSAEDGVWLRRTLDREYRRFGGRLAPQDEGWILEWSTGP